LLAADQVAITGIIRLELLSGARSDQEWLLVSRVLSGLHLLPVEERIWEQEAQMAYRLRRIGVTVPSTDLLIAAVAEEAGAVVLHRDRHFDLIAAHLPVTVESHLA